MHHQIYFNIKNPAIYWIWLDFYRGLLCLLQMHCRAERFRVRAILVRARLAVHQAHNEENDISHNRDHRDKEEPSALTNIMESSH